MSKNIIKILSGLYLSDFETAKNREILETHQINVIINVAVEVKHNSSFGDSKIKIYQYDIEDDSKFQIQKYFHPVADLINYHLSIGDNILVHCHAGLCRSPSIIIAYLMIFQKMSFETAYYHIATSKNICIGNFVNKLNRLNAELYHSEEPWKTKFKPPTCF